MTPAKAQEMALALAIVAVVGVVAYVFIRGPGGIAKDAVKGVVDVGTGAVLGISEAIGIPDTDASLCEAAKREGRTYDASKYCPAGDFLGYLFRSDPAALVVQARSVPGDDF